MRRNHSSDSLARTLLNQLLMRIATAAAGLAACALLASTARAQPAGSPPSDASGQPRQPARPPVSERPEKSGSLATGLAIGGAVAGVGTLALAVQYKHDGLGWAGMALTSFGPSAGHIYAGEGGHAAAVSLLRAGGVATYLYGEIQEDLTGDAYIAKWIGGAIVVGTTLYDLVDARRAARRTNMKRERAWAVAPTMIPSATGERAPGLALAGSF